jgi:hypothetical protein
MGLAATYGPEFYHQKANDYFGGAIQDDSIMMYDLFVIMCLSAFFLVHLPSWYFPR